MQVSFELSLGYALFPLECRSNKHRTSIPTLQAGMTPPVRIFHSSFVLLVLLVNQHPKPCHSFLLVGVLAAFLGTLHRLSGGEVDSPNTAFYLVDVLSTFSTTAKCLKYDLFRIKICCSGCSAKAEIQEPVFSLVIGTVWAAANPLD